MDDKFYKNQKQVEQIVHEFGNAILKNKNQNKPFFSPYRVFKYSEEQNENAFPYSPQDGQDFINEFSKYFENSVNWDSTGVLYNVHPNVNVYGMIASLFAGFANPNFAQDISSGKLMMIEKEVVTYLSELSYWDKAAAGGVFTFGGKSTNLYALKIALDKICPDLRTKGLKEKVKVISNDLGHPCHVEICNWMGVGTENCIRLKTGKNSTLPVESFIIEFKKIINSGEKLPLIILNGMSTLNHAIDDIKAIAEARDRIVKEYGLDYKPHIHVDAVLGWAYLLLGRYDFNSNPLRIDSRILSIMENKYKFISNIKYADSFGADFHKTGFCSYASSVFMTRDKDTLHQIENAYSEDENLEFSKLSPYNYTLELSRSAHGPVSAFATLKTLGIEGFVQIIANLTEAFLYLKETFNEQLHTEVLNYNEDSNILFFIFKPSKDIVIKENMDIDVVNEIKDLNTDFYQFLVHKLEKSETNVFFSCSRSHKYLDQSFGSIKVYCWNSNFNKDEAKNVAKEINNLYKEYIKGHKTDKDYNIFDFLDVKGAK